MKLNQEEIIARGSNVETVIEQLKQFETGFPFMKLKSAATIGKGILKIENKEEALNCYNNFLSNGGDILKFVPASGAASRMFKQLFSFKDGAKDMATAKEMLKSDKEMSSLFANISNIAFWNDIKTLLGDNLYIDGELNYPEVAKAILDSTGLNYGSLPKGVLKFHSYEAGSKTPFAEHLSEAISYANVNNNCNLHFTVSPEHTELFKEEAKVAIAAIGEGCDINFTIDYSAQKASTDTIAAAPDNKPFDDNGKLLFRPGGHGALLENLNELDSDIIFIKNIDNVVPDRLKEDTITYKKVIGGVLIETRDKIFGYLKELEGDISAETMTEIFSFIANKLCFVIDTDISKLSIAEQKELAITILDRPIRVCGMVKNEGEPGGGPFWCESKDGSVSLQIVEGSQIDPEACDQQKIVTEATHFNPVDLVCGIKNYKGEKFDLLKYRDMDTCFISTKSKDGKELKALELPGLWNGAMANWNTMFVEVPVSTFNPVKTINDLLRDQHQ